MTIRGLWGLTAFAGTTVYLTMSFCWIIRERISTGDDDLRREGKKKGNSDDPLVLVFELKF